MAKLTKDYFGSAEGEEIRINKYLSDAGICSRREADALVGAGKVLIDGIPAVMGSKVRAGQKVTVAGKEARKDERMVLIAFNKPQGIVCTADRREPDNIVDYINYGSRIFPIGRLDKDSEGLILLTNDGEIVNKILRAGNGHEKEYIVQVNKPLTEDFLKGMAGGVPVLDTVTKPCLVEQLDKTTFRIVLTQGLNRQIRRMCEYFGYRVRALQRVRVMNISLGRLKTGTWRNLTQWELEELNQMLKDSSNEPAAQRGTPAADQGMPAEGIAIVKAAAGKPKSRVKDKKAQQRPAQEEKTPSLTQRSPRKTLGRPAQGEKAPSLTQRPPRKAFERPAQEEKSPRPKTGIKGVGFSEKKKETLRENRRERWQQKNKDGAVWKKRRTESGN